VLLTTNPNYTPTGLGPAPSGRSGGTGAQATGFSLLAGGNDDMLSGSFCGCGSHRRTPSSDVLDDGNDEEELLDGPA